MSRLKNELSKKKLTMSANTTVDIPGIKTQSVAADQDTVISFGRVRLAIPAGAVTTATEITIEQLREVSELNPGLNNTTQGANGYRFKPDGIKFLKPVSVTIPYDRTIPREDLANLYTYFYNEDCQCWERLERVDVDTANATVTSLTTHFTDLINGVLTVPETAKPLNFNPTSIKEIKAADPGTGINLINPPQAGSQGTAGLSYPLEIPPGRNGLQPQLTVQYNSDGGNGWLGLGWALPLPNIAIDTRWGAPRYSDDNETETYLLNGLQLTPLAHRGVPEPRTAEKVFHTRVEGEFCRIIRHGDYPSDYWWEVTDKQGIRYFYGGTPEKGQKPAALLCDFFGVLESEEAEQDDDYMGWPWHVFKWFLTRVQDTNGNTIDYSYQSAWDTSKDDGGQLYLSKISYTGSNGVKGLYTINFIRDRELGEMQRSDVSIDGRPGFLVATADLLRKVEVKFQEPSRRACSGRSFSTARTAPSLTAMSLPIMIKCGTGTPITALRRRRPGIPAMTILRLICPGLTGEPVYWAVRKATPAAGISMWECRSLLRKKQLPPASKPAAVKRTMRTWWPLLILTATACRTKYLKKTGRFGSAPIMVRFRRPFSAIRSP